MTITNLLCRSRPYGPLALPLVVHANEPFFLLVLVPILGWLSLLGVHLEDGVRDISGHCRSVRVL